MGNEGTETLRRILGSKMILPIVTVAVRGLLWVAKRFGMSGEVF
jgi:hypothetical protein